MKKGFTLVELLAVIAVLGIISSIAVVSYSKVIKDNKVRECKRKVSYIEQKAIEYANENNLLVNKEVYTIEINTDEKNKDKSFFNYKELTEEDFQNPISESLFSGEIKITQNSIGITDAEVVGVVCE